MIRTSEGVFGGGVGHGAVACVNNVQLVTVLFAEMVPSSLCTNIMHGRRSFIDVLHHRWHSSAVRPCCDASTLDAS